MPKAKGRGGKNRKKGKGEQIKLKRELIFKDADTEYARVTKMLGNGRLEAYCYDSVKRICHIRGKMRKKDDIILVSLRDFQDNKCDVILKYQNVEIQQLMQMGELPDNTKLNEENEEDANIVFRESDLSDNDSDDDDSDEEKQNEQQGGEDKKHAGGGGGKAKKGVKPTIQQYAHVSSSEEDNSEEGEPKQKDELGDI